MTKHWIHASADEQAVERLQAQLGISSVLCKLLVQRGIYDYDQAKAFFVPSLEQVHSPFLMADMAPAVERLEAALSGNEGIFLYGDYDVDGTTAVALMRRFLKGLGAERLHTHLPDRHTEGYGLSLLGVERARSLDCSLMLVMDCGIGAHRAVDYARSLGIDAVILDHHLPSKEGLPGALAILNPKRGDCPYPYKELSGCGLAFKLAQGLAERMGLPVWERLEPLLDLVALAAVGDYVALTGENRVLTHFGLQRFNRQPCPGLAALRLCLNRSSEVYTVRDLVFGICPLLNAAGRMDHPDRALELLLEEDPERAEQAALRLLRLNEMRRDREAEVLEQALEQVGNPEQSPCIVAYGEHWHKGVQGIVAARLAERFARPALVLVRDQPNGNWTGSGRSWGDLDLYAALSDCSELLLGFGGHQQAAGFRLEHEQLPQFCSAFERSVAARRLAGDIQDELVIDAEIELSRLDEPFMRILRRFEPFGPSNMRPVFLSKMLRDTGYSRPIGSGGQHLRLVVRQSDSPAFEGVAFGRGSDYEQIASRQPFHCCYVLEETWRDGAPKVRLEVRDWLLG